MDPREPRLGFIFENHALVTALYAQLTALHAQGRLTLICPSRVTGLRVDASAAELSVDQGALRARLVVAADGGASNVR